MLDHSHLPGQGNGEVFRFVGQVQAATPIAPQVFQKPRGKSMFHIQLIGKGGDGGAGVIGAVSTAAGGGGGGSGGQTSILIPAWALPDMLFLFLAGIGSGSAQASYISARPVSNVAAQIFMMAGGGSNGGNGSGATAGGAGAAGGVASASNMPLGWMWLQSALAGQAGTAGGTISSSSSITLPTSGLLLTGGTGGAGLGASGSTGSSGGQIGSTAGDLLPLIGGLGGSSTTSPPNNGSGGIYPLIGCSLAFGGTGGGSTHGSATGAGLVQASGGNGAPGCGGGGSGGALTGSTAGVVGKGGPAICIITCW